LELRENLYRLTAFRVLPKKQEAIFRSVLKENYDKKILGFETD